MALSVYRRCVKCKEEASKQKGLPREGMREQKKGKRGREGGEHFWQEAKIERLDTEEGNAGNGFSTTEKGRRAGKNIHYLAINIAIDFRSRYAKMKPEDHI